MHCSNDTATEEVVLTFFITENHLHNIIFMFMTSSSYCAPIRTGTGVACLDV